MSDKWPPAVLVGSILGTPPSYEPHITGREVSLMVCRGFLTNRCLIGNSSLNQLSAVIQGGEL